MNSRVNTSVKIVARNVQRAAVLSELAICIPLIVLLAAGCIDIGLYFGDHLELTQISYEGGRLGSKLALLEDVSGRGVTCSSDGGVTTTPCAGLGGFYPAARTNHAVVHSRLMLLTKLSQVRRRSATIETKVDLDRATSTITVSLSTKHYPLWGFIPIAIPLRSTSKATYLY